MLDFSLDSIDPWLAAVREHVCLSEPTLLTLLDTYIAEARFGRHYIAKNLETLPAKAHILEIGAGSLLLSCQLKREGFNIVALEPISHGFSHFKRLRELVLDQAEKFHCVPDVLNQCAENLNIQDCFDFVFSINVMEHVFDVEAVIRKVTLSLRHKASYRFTCPNYLFPYEPHFNMMTLFSKSLTEKIFKKRIFNCQTVQDPKGTWQSLNWISVLQLRRLIKDIPDVQIKLNQKFLLSILIRMTNDSEFSERRSKFVRNFIKILVYVRLHYLANFIPSMLQPMIDCTLMRK